MIAQGKPSWRSGGPQLRVYAFPHHRPRAGNRFTLGLTPRQSALVVAVFFASLTAALVLAWWFRRRNMRQASP